MFPSVKMPLWLMDGVDFKFKNNSKNDIKIYASTDDKNVTVRIVEI